MYNPWNLNLATEREFIHKYVIGTFIESQICVQNVKLESSE